MFSKPFRDVLQGLSLILMVVVLGLGVSPYASGCKTRPSKGEYCCASKEKGFLKTP